MNDKCLKYDSCPLALVQRLLSGKRKIMILWYLSNKVLRFSGIKRRLPDVTQKMLKIQFQQ
nr:winged helix-turn-helix transcriptional regulator [Desulfosporosinus orientis]